jgi:hypothetical protein
LLSSRPQEISMNWKNVHKFGVAHTLGLAALFFSGLAVISPSAILAGTSGTWATTGTMNTGRLAHTATLLANGRVLVAGGISSADQTIASAELYNPATGMWTVTGSMKVARYGHSAVLLPSGKVLVAGGITGTSGGMVTAEAELYNPSTGKWTRTGSMEAPRYLQGAALLQNGQVLVAGGISSSVAIASAEIYNPATGQWAFTSSMNDARATQAALLENGEVLMAGGAVTGNTAELYSNGIWTLTNNMVFSHPSVKSVALTDGDGLVYGGNLASYVAEFFDPSTGVWTATHNLGINPPSGSLTGLNTGNVLLAGGSIHVGTEYVEQTGCHLYNPSSNAWSGTGSMHQARSAHTATLLQNGQVLAAGGGSTVLGSAEIYTP